MPFEIWFGTLLLLICFCHKRTKIKDKKTLRFTVCTLVSKRWWRSIEGCKGKTSAVCQKKKKKIALSRPGPPRSGQPPWPVSRVGQNLVFSCLRSVRFACASEISLLFLLSERRLLYAVCLFASCGLTPFSSLPIESSGLSLSLSHSPQQRDIFLE